MPNVFPACLHSFQSSDVNFFATNTSLTDPTEAPIPRHVCSETVRHHAEYVRGNNTFRLPEIRNLWLWNPGEANNILECLHPLNGRFIYVEKYWEHEHP